MAGAPPTYSSLFPDGRSGRADAAAELGLSGDERALPAPGRRLLSSKRTRVAGLAAAGLLAVAGVAALAAVPRQAGTSAALAAQQMKEEVVKDDDSKRKCSDTAHNCNETKCCSTPGYQCYEKLSGPGGWAQCRTSCVPGPDPIDPSPQHWSCNHLGSRTEGDAPPLTWVPKAAPWVAKNCSNSSADCSHSRCCTESGTACFRKSDKWSRCKASCTPGPDTTDNNDQPWDCKQLGGKTPGLARVLPVADWVKKKCASNRDNCIHSKCCKDPGHQCYQKNENFAMCEPVCTRGMSLTDKKDWKPWTCKALGSATPGALNIPEPPQLAGWVDEHCSDYGEDCTKSRCCKHEASQCYSQDDSYASCLYGCVPGHKNFSKHAYCQKHHKNSSDPSCKFDGKTWDCKKLGPRTPRPWGNPTLFCMHVMRVNSYEADIVRGQLAMGGKFRGGIFSCDQYALYASDAPGGTLLGDGPLGPVKTRHFQSAPVWTSKDGTAANTALFMNVWEAVRYDMKYRCCDWTIKADPDAVVLPDRLRYSLKKYGGRPTFVLTCNKGFADGPMMFGAMEAIASSALDRYFNSESTCRNMPWQSWGEDLWMGKCLMSLGIGPVEDHGIVGDSLCYGANCGNGYSGAYHPFKNKDSWMQCYWQAEG